MRSVASTIVLHTQPVVLTSALPGRTAPVVGADARPQVSSVFALNCGSTSQQPKRCGESALVSPGAPVSLGQLTCSWSSPASSHAWRDGSIHFSEGR